MTTFRPFRLVLPLLFVLALGACDLRTGPVIGDWHGVEDTLSVYYYARVEIILDGPPGATSGRYHYNRLLQQPEIGPGQRFTEWDDRWTMRPIVVDGRTLSLVTLHDLPDAWIPDYLLLPDGRLVPEPDPRKIDLSRNAMTFALSPEPRDTFGYGRP